MTKELKWVLLCLAVAAGEGAGFALGQFASAWPLPLALSVLAAVFGYGFSWRPWPYLALALLGFALALRATDRRRQALDEILEIHAGRPVTAIFLVGDDMRETVGKGGTRVTFDGAVKEVPVRVHLALGDGEPRPRPGEVWSCTGWVGRSADGPFGRRRPFWVSGRGTGCRRLAASPGGWTAAFIRLKADVSRRVGLGLGHAPETADLNRAMLLGERHRMGREARDAFVAAGTVHVFAISGLHVLFIAHLLELLLRFTGLPRPMLVPALLPLVWGYVVLVGCGPSAVRAATMASFYYSAGLFWRRPNGFTAWSLAFLVTYLWSPERMLDIGCAFSFVVMFALVLWSSWCQSLVPRWFRYFCFSAITWAAGVPLAAHAFGRITPGGLLANLVVMPLAEVSVSAAALGVLCSAVSDGIAAHFNNFSALSTSLMAGLSRLIGSWSWSNQTVEPWSVSDCIACYAGGILLLLFLRSLLRRRVQFV